MSFILIRKKNKVAIIKSVYINTKTICILNYIPPKL